MLMLLGEPKGTWQESWKAMEEMQKKGKIRSLGVSNFYIQDLEELVKLATVPVSTVQNWFDPFHQDRQVRKFCQEHNIRYIGYSTLGKVLLNKIFEISVTFTSAGFNVFVLDMFIYDAQCLAFVISSNPHRPWISFFVISFCCLP